MYNLCSFHLILDIFSTKTMGKGDEGAGDPTKKCGQVIYLGPDKAPEKLGCSDSLYFLDEA